MNSITLIACLALGAGKATTAPPTPPAAPPEPAVAASVPTKSMKFVLDPTRKVYEVGVNFAYQTTLWTPVTCSSPAVGDPELFAVMVPDSSGRRFVLAVKVEQPGSKTNVTFSCDEGVRFSVEAIQVPEAKAVLIVEFDFSTDESSRVRAVAETERKLAREQCDARLADTKELVEKEIQEQFVRGMLRRLTAHNDQEAARERFVIVHVMQELLVGGRGYILFDVQNLSGKEVAIRDVEVLAEDGNAAMDGVALAMQDRRVVPGATVSGVAAFDAPDDISTLVMVVHEDGPRSIRVDDIDF